MANRRGDPPTKQLQQRPAFQFYPKDWLSNSALRMCSIGARGLWIDMMSIMHEGSPYGYFAVNGKGILPPVLARRVGESLQDVLRWLGELQEHGVFRCDERGVIYSKRMVRDEHNREVRAAGGVKSLDHPNVPKRKDGRKDTFDGSPASASADGSAVAVVCASKNDSESGSRTISGLSAELVRFVDRFYGNAYEGRRARVVAQLRSALDPTGLGARIGGDVYAKARDLAHLESCCRAVFRKPPEKADAALVWVLKKLRDPWVDSRGLTVTEAASANTRVEDTLLNSWNAEASAAVATWARGRPDEFKSIEKLAETFAASERMSSTEPGYDVAVRGIVAKKAREAAGFPEFDDWQSVRKNGRIQQLEGSNKT